ncbi:hypothetical protein [Kitasatospora sp. MAP5-34]|uniref:hypothetical protein n=1 Tax=Kitasatospora sp. MAP5-34 TaxID=3035102 RepID=UPI0024743A19|nr:hypothetical protein [Kitasatospora sp. MAP5-34]MDH6580735.1 hypothetical protein [Kitasatospora sp. MAP5-34]
MAVAHAHVLSQLNPLADGTVTGLKQVARHRKLTVTAELHQTGHHDEYDGILVRIISATAGELDHNVFPFANYRVLPGLKDYVITAYDHTFLATPGSVHPKGLQDAVARYLAHFG